MKTFMTFITELTKNQRKKREAYALTYIRQGKMGILRIRPLPGSKWIEVRGKEGFEYAYDDNEFLHRTMTLIGKGVCFDSGGLDLKPSDNMLLMKKDMGGAAHVLALAKFIMEAELDIRLRVLIPAVENSVSGSAFRPGDVIKTRSGKTVEIGNTDAEGRLILCDALAEASQESPDLMIDIATLTGAARVALGTEVAAMFTDNEELAGELSNQSVVQQDPLWRLPLWEGYLDDLESSVADYRNVPSHRYGGAISAGLFLQKFVSGVPAWVHFDIMGWNRKLRPGRSVGGEAFALRALAALLLNRYGESK